MPATTLPPELLVEGLNALFLQRMLGNEAADFVGRVANIVPTTKKTQTFAYLSEVPAFREWVDRRQISSLATAVYELTAADWESSLGIDMRDMEDEQIPMLGRQIMQLADQARRHAMQRMVEVMVASQTLICYDGVSFFNDAHPALADEGATQDNDLAATTTGGGGTVPDLQTDYDAAHVAMSRFLDGAGQPFHGDVAPSFLWVAPPELWRNFTTLLFSNTQQNNDGNNVYQGQGDLAVTARLTNTGDYYCLKTDGIVRPFIFLERQPIQTTNSMTPNETWRPTKEVVYGADARYQAGVGMWQYAISFT